MTEQTPEEQGYVLLPENPEAVQAFLSRDDHAPEAARRLQMLINHVLMVERKRVRPMVAGSNIEVKHRGEWTRGTIANVHKGGLLEVETERGPLSAYAKSIQVRWPENEN